MYSYWKQWVVKFEIWSLMRWDSEPIEHFPSWPTRWTAIILLFTPETFRCLPFMVGKRPHVFPSPFNKLNVEKSSKSKSNHHAPIYSLFLHDGHKSSKISIATRYPTCLILNSCTSFFRKLVRTWVGQVREAKQKSEASSW